MRLRFSIFILCLLPAAVLAETRFVELEVTLRSGQGTSFSIVRMVRSGSPVEVLETSAASGYSRVRVAGGTEGWILTRYLTDSPIGAEALVAARQRVDQLSRENRELIEERNRLMSEGDDLAGDLQRLKDLSANAISLEQTNQRLTAAAARHEQTIEGLSAENARLASTARRDWFLAGAGVLVAGLLFGLILPRIRWQRRRKWNDL
ncbi:MAG: TIGR04211 family SH3 domain-containing protein [Gammaproteobacteria bacterium]